MDKRYFNKVWQMVALRYRSHPWHGIHIGEECPKIVNTYIEVVPTDTVKYELDKASGYLKVDRPQKFSNIVPALYGFVPQTYCGYNIAKFCEQKTGYEEIVGDGDPLDILILTERNITHGDILVPAIPIGGLRMIDGGEADDKIIAVLKGDEVYDEWQDINDCPKSIVERIRHYFLTYKEMPGQDQGKRKCEITHIYGREEAHEVISKSQQDYRFNFGNIESKLSVAAMEAIENTQRNSNS